MKRILFMLTPFVMILLAFRPVSFHTVSGTITDGAGTPVASVSVIVKGTNVATVSAQDGTYQINVTDKNATLVFSAVGYKSQEVKVKGKVTINVTLKSASTELKEVVVIGYGQRHKRDLAYKSMNAGAPIQGRVAGVHIQSGQGYRHDGEYEDFNTEGYD